MPLLADPLDDALSSRAKVRLLRLLVGEREPLSAREAARRIAMAKRSADLGLRDLVQAGVVSRLGSGPQPSYVINPHSALVRHAIAPLFRGGRGATDETGGGEAGAITELFETLRDAVEVPDPQAVLWAGLFGSTANGEDEVTSDIDLGVIVRNEEAIRTMQERLAGMTPIVRRRFGRVLSPVIMTRAQLGALARSGHSLVTGLGAGRFVAGSVRRFEDLLRDQD